MDLQKNIVQLLLALIIGIVSLGVSFIGDMSNNIHRIAVSVTELNSRMGQVMTTVNDHEGRLREVEKTQQKRR